ncbi:hypothetical protein [Methylobacterium sp. Gmos1]
MTEMTEFELASALAKQLSYDGAVELVYLTAEFQPFSNAQKPDIIFKPRRGAWAGQIVIIEIKIESAPRRTGRAYQNLVEHKQFCAESLNERIAKLIFVTNQPVPQFSVALLARDGIIVVDHSGEADQTATAIRSALALSSSS